MLTNLVASLTVSWVTNTCYAPAHLMEAVVKVEQVSKVTCVEIEWEGQRTALRKVELDHQSWSLWTGTGRDAQQLPLNVPMEKMLPPHRPLPDCLTAGKSPSVVRSGPARE